MSLEEQIMFKDKYPSIFSPQMGAIVFIILQIFFATRAVLKIGEYSRKLVILFVVIVAAVIVLGLGSIVSVVCSIALSKRFKPFM